MTAENWARITDQLNAILEEPETEASVLASEPPEIRVEVARLLHAHRAADRDSTDRDLAAPDKPRVLADRYELTALLGSGGSGAAWLSHDLRTGQQVVIKLPLHWEWFRQDLTRRFHSEADILRGLKHPGIVAILDSGTTEEGSPFLVMPYLEGLSLRTLLERGPLNHESAARMVEQLGEAIYSAHQSNVIHRDIKPENVMIEGGSQRAVLIDFGISLFSDLKEESGTTTRFFGTTRYMAPEQLLGKPAFASDVYALTLIAYEMWTGTPLLLGETPVALYEEQRQLTESRVGGRNVPASLRAVLWEGLQSNPAKRPPIEQFAPKLAREMRNPGRFAMPSRRALLAGAAVLIPGAGWLGYQNRPLSAAERTVIYKAGQTFDLVGWQKAAKVDLDVTVGDADGTRIVGNRLMSTDQGAYFNRLSPRVRREGLKRRWRLAADVMPIHGYSGAGVCFREAGTRFTVGAEVPDNEEPSIVAYQSFTPVIRKLRTPFELEPNRLYRFEMVFDPAAGCARVMVDGRLVFEDFRGTPEYLEIPGVSVGFGVQRSKTGEGVFGDVTFVME